MNVVPFPQPQETFRSVGAVAEAVARDAGMKALTEAERRLSLALDAATRLETRITELQADLREPMTADQRAAAEIDLETAREDHLSAIAAGGCALFQATEFRKALRLDVHPLLAIARAAEALVRASQ
jgi:hypothetical protein